MALQYISKGIYLSIVTRIRKLPLRTDLPIFLCGGVVAFHPYFKELLSDEFSVPVNIASDPQYIVALGASILANRIEIEKQ